MSREPLKGRGSYKVWREIGTRWGDNDGYGHVNNTIYYTWFDTAVNAWLIEQELLEVAAGDPIGLVVETGCRYAQPLSHPQIVDIGLVAEAIGKSSVRYRLGVFAQNRDEASRRDLSCMSVSAVGAVVRCRCPPDGATRSRRLPAENARPLQQSSRFALS